MCRTGCTKVYIEYLERFTDKIYQYVEIKNLKLITGPLKNWNYKGSDKTLSSIIIKLVIRDDKYKVL